MSESSNDDEALPGVAASEEIHSGDTGQESSSPQVESPAESTPATQKDDNKPKDMAAAVRAALDLGKEQSSGSGEDEDKDPKASGEAQATPGVEEPLGDMTEEELNSYKGKTHRRFKQLDTRNKALAAELEQSKPMAELGSTIKNMAAKANLSREDLNTGFNVMRLMRNDPVQAYEALTPIYQALCDIVGAKLPGNLQEQVNSGALTVEAAQEMSRLRAAQGLRLASDKEQQARSSREAEEARMQDIAKLSADVGTAVSDWETRWKKSDPDYAHKQSRVLDAIDLELLKRKDAGTLPSTVKDALAMCDAIKTKVDNELKKLLPKRNTPIDHVTGNGAMNGSKPVPKTSREAIAQAVGHH